MEGLETSGVKKPKLDISSTPAETDAVQQTDEGDQAEDDEVLEEPATTIGVELQAPVASTDPAQFKQQQKGKKGKGKGSDGGGTHFNENPYTFVSPDDPLLQTCMYVSMFLLHPTVLTGYTARSCASSPTSPPPTSLCATPAASPYARST